MSNFVVCIMYADWLARISVSLPVDRVTIKLKLHIYFNGSNSCWFPKITMCLGHAIVSDYISRREYIFNLNPLKMIYGNVKIDRCKGYHFIA